MVRSAYNTLYKVLMNINESSCRPYGLGLALIVIGVSAWYPDNKKTKNQDRMLGEEMWYRISQYFFVLDSEVVKWVMGCECCHHFWDTQIILYCSKVRRNVCLCICVKHQRYHNASRISLGNKWWYWHLRFAFWRMEWQRSKKNPNTDVTCECTSTFTFGLHVKHYHY